MVHSPQLLMGTEHSSSAQLKSFPAYCSGTTRPGLQLSSTRINSPGKQPGNGHRAPGGAGHGCSPAGQASTSEIRCTPRAVSQQPSEKSTPHWQVLRNSLESSPCKPSGIHSSPQSHHSHPGCDSGSCEAELCCSHRTRLVSGQQLCSLQLSKEQLSRDGTRNHCRDGTPSQTGTGS